MRRRGALGQLLDGLGDGDPVAWGFVGIFVVIALFVGAVALYFRRKMRLEDEQRAKKYGRKPN